MSKVDPWLHSRGSTFNHFLTTRFSIKFYTFAIKLENQKNEQK